MRGWLACGAGLVLGQASRAIVRLQAGIAIGLRPTQRPPFPIMPKLSVAIGSDHAGFRYKEEIKKMLLAQGYTVRDFGTYSAESCDYPTFIRPTAEAVARGEFDRGIVLGGSGNGEAIVANKVKGIRCGLCWSVETAVANRDHNDGNVLALGERMVSLELALQIVQLWLETPFSNDPRHVRRIQAIEG